MSDQLVVIATPAFDHNVTVQYAQSILETDWALGKAGIDRAFVFVGGDPYLSKVRNLCVSRAIARYPNMTDLFFIDADVTWPAEAAIRFLKSPVDVVAGVYPKKNDALEFPTFLKLKSNEVPEYIVENGLYEANAVPTGFLRIKRHVLDKMMAKVGTYKDATAQGETVRNIFEMGWWPNDPANLTGEGEWWGEDFAWSRRWLEMGGTLWVDPNIEFGHRGSKEWRSNFLEHGIRPSIRDGIAKMPNPNKPRLVEACASDFGVAAE